MPIKDLQTIFRKSNRTVAILHLINLVINALVLFGFIVLVYGIRSGFYQASNLPQADISQVEELLQSVTRDVQFNHCINIIFNIAIMSLAFRNQARFNQKGKLSELPYLLGYSLFFINIFADLIATGFTLNMALQLFYLPFYINSRNSARLLNALNQVWPLTGKSNNSKGDNHVSSMIQIQKYPQRTEYSTHRLWKHQPCFQYPYLFSKYRINNCSSWLR